MAFPHRSIREWLRDIHLDLEGYAAKFDDLGYNGQFLIETESADLEDDLKDLVKKVHLRVILKEHAKLTTLKFLEHADAAPAGPQVTQASRKSVESPVLKLIPCAKDVTAFQPDPQSIRNGHVVLIPIWCLRSIQGKVRSEMTFTSGKNKDSSVYELMHDMLSGRQRPEDVEPLQVVVNEHGLHIVRGHRRGLALCALQGIWRDRTVLAPCRLYKAEDPEIASQFANMDTMVDGLSIQLHGKLPEAWHMGKPLFRNSQEWCDSMADMPVTVQTLSESSQLRLQYFNKSGPQNARRRESLSTSGTAQASPPVTLQLARALGSQCVEHHQPMTESATQPSCKSSETRNGSTEGCAELKENMVVCVTGSMGSGSRLLVGKILEVSRSRGVKVRYRGSTATGQSGSFTVDWFPLERLKVPNFSKLKQGMHATVEDVDSGSLFHCNVLQVSKEEDRVEAPVYVHYHGYESDYDEWVGADRIRSKALIWHEPSLPSDIMKSQHSESESAATASDASDEESAACMEAKVVCCRWLAGKCLHTGHHVHGKKLHLHEDIQGLQCGFGASCWYKHYERKSAFCAEQGELKEGMVICVCSGSQMVSGKILDISGSRGVKVRYAAREEAGTCHAEWLPLERLKVPDFSKFKQGMNATVEDVASGSLFHCKVLQVSNEEDRVEAPVYVHYHGYESDYDEWVGADRIRSKALIWHEPSLPSDIMKSQHSESESAATDSDESDEKFAAELQASLLDKFVCCMWLAGKCWLKGHHSLEGKLFLHEDIPGLQCGFGASCRYKHYETRSCSIATPVNMDHSESQSVEPHHLQTATALRGETRERGGAYATPDALPTLALPWCEPLDSGTALEDTLPQRDRQLGPREEDSGSDSGTDFETSIPPSNDMESSCLGAPNDWEDRMARQPSILDSFQQLPGLIVFGTFRSVSGKDVWKCSGEVIVHQGPAPLHGCKVKIWGGKTRGPTWDYDRCYVRILDARIWGASDERSDGSPVDTKRMELFGRIVHAMEFGVPRQKLFVCVRPKVVHNPNFVAFKPINGKLPVIIVPWNPAAELPSSHDLHVVEVLNWSGDRQPTGQYLEDLKMSSRDSDMSILEAVQISLNFNDWLRGNPRGELRVDLPKPPRRSYMEGSSLTVGIQHPGLPIGMVMSCGQNEFHVHVLDVNAYLDALGMEKIENLLRQRSVGAWFLDHLDNPLEANLPLFPPNIEEKLTFKAGEERRAVTFTIQAARRNLEVFAVRETTVRCDHILTPQQAGEMICSDEGGDVGQVLRRLNSQVVELRGADFAELLVIALSIPGPLLASERLLQGCMRVVDRYVAATLTATAWNQLLKEPDEDPQLTVRHIQGRIQNCGRMVIERLLRLKKTDGDKEIQIADIMRTLQDILKQPGLTKTQRHACRSSFLRRLHAALPATYYEVSQASSDSRDPCDWWHWEPRFHVTSPLRRYIDILGMRALKSQLGWTASHPHLLLSRRELDEAVARTNCRMAAESFGRHIFRTISRMRELSGSGQQIANAVIGAVGPKYIHILVPSEKAHTLELQVPVSSLCSSTCVSEYDVTTQSIKLTMQNERDQVETLRIHSWFAQSMTCVIARNYAQPIPHHASPNSIVVWEIRFHGEKDFIFPTGLKSFPESFSSWPDLTDWPLLDRKVETYSQVWSRIKLSQVHAAAVSSDDTPPAAVNDLKWFRISGAWHFQCQVDVKLLRYQWLEPGDLAVLSLSLERSGECATLQGTLVKIRGNWPTLPVEDGTRSFIVEVELSKIAELAWQAQDFSLNGTPTWRLHFILIPPNEKKSIQLLQDMQRSCPLQGMRLTIPRSTTEMKKDMEMRPLVTISEVKCAMQSACASKLNEKQTLAIQRALQRPFSMVQGPPGTGKTSMLVQCVAALLSAPRPRWKGDGRILVCAPSNHAADHILDRLISAGISPHYVTRIYSRFIERCHGSGYKGGTTKWEGRFEIQPHLEEHALHWKVGESPQVKFLPAGWSQEAFDKSYEAREVQILRDSRVVITTCTNAFLHTSMVQGEPPHVVRPVSFGSIVIDEAAQASEPDVVLAATSASCRVIVVGDHKQLGPVVTEHNLSVPYISALETPFLERLHQNPRRLSTSTMLNEQYRMHPSIRSFPSSQFYQSMLEDRVSIPHRPQLNCVWPQKKDHRVFIDCQTPQSMGLSPELNRNCDAALMESKVSLKNVGEARSVVAACAALLRQKCDPRDIAVITPYKAQQHEIRARLEREVGAHSKSILIGTVHALQGSEREYIIVSFVRSTSQDEDVVTSVAKTAGDSVALQEMYGESLGILKNYRVLNVAITRAKYGLVCVGNADVLSKGSKDFNAFIHSLRSCRCIRSQKEFLESVRTRKVRKSLRLSGA